MHSWGTSQGTITCGLRDVWSPQLGVHKVTQHILRVFSSTTCVTRVSSDNVNITSEHQEPAEVLSQLGNTSNSPVYREYKLLTSDGMWTKTCVPDKAGCSCRITTQGVQLARQRFWCCACRSSSPVLHESYYRILSLCLGVVTIWNAVKLLLLVSYSSCSRLLNQSNDARMC